MKIGNISVKKTDVNNSAPEFAYFAKIDGKWVGESFQSHVQIPAEGQFLRGETEGFKALIDVGNEKISKLASMLNSGEISKHDFQDIISHAVKPQV